MQPALVRLFEFPRSGSRRPAALRLYLPFVLADLAPVALALAAAPALVWSLLPLLGAASAAMGLYPGIGLHPVTELRLGARASALALGALALLALAAGRPAGFGLALLAAWPLLTACLSVTRAVLRHYLARTAWWGEPVLILGLQGAGQRAEQSLLARPALGLRPFTVVDTAALDPLLLESAALLALHHGVRCALVAMPRLDGASLASLADDYCAQFERVLIVPNLAGLASLETSVFDLGGLACVEIGHRLLSPLPRLAKRAYEVVLTATLLALLAPLLLLLVAAVRLSSEGPAFYGQRRIGYRGRSFTAWKLRTMRRDADLVLEHYLAAHPEMRAEWQRDHKLRRDPRVTPLGRLLRVTSLDELPQLWNVLNGEMSLVGPRPIVRAEIPRYGPKFALYRRVRPGLSGLWQVSGRNNTSYEERVRLDEFYVRNWSIWLDLWIAARTVKTVLFREGAC